MATSDKNYTDSPQEETKICDKHGDPIDIFCVDCDEFLCSSCTKADHRVHDWDTVSNIANQRRRGLPAYLRSIKREVIPGIDERISLQIRSNENECNSGMEMIQKSYEEIVERLMEIKKRQEQAIRDNLTKKNEQVNRVVAELREKRKQLGDKVQFAEDMCTDNVTEEDLSDTEKELSGLLCDLDVDVKDCNHSVRFQGGEIRADVLESMLGQLSNRLET